ncbi:hypothetical protein YH66_09675 [[Brevibacterium] flavum]|uniref:Uncharacterized protein n=2 Tax=Corynebacteriaceae TaxID=1653 RepID=A0A0F6WRX3_9CORY|nr:hypothetical protein [Corynebacterium glutamicum]AKF28982.1 hypothetical protein YH66_09675 [[Brevibacterium] flavum]AST21044.1 hypothetical protein CEY17_09815 [Corynebacterium glutamicum ATCC 14067]KIH73301.1 hypothetical protein SD36_09705 [Corynebacterium glutamicum]OKX96148.1 hypothetical protein AUP71_01690 [Corynebacterium glutamicum]
MQKFVTQITLSVIVFFSLSVAIGFFSWDAKSTLISTALTNVAAVGGVASGLSFAGLSVLSLNGKYKEMVLKEYGHIARNMLFYLLYSVMVAALWCAIAVIWVEHQWVRITFAIAVFVILECFFLTFRIVFSAYEWESLPEPTDPGIDPEFLQQGGQK